MQCSGGLEIADARASDLVEITDLFNAYVRGSSCILVDEPVSVQSRRAWFEDRGPMHPVVVGRMDGTLAGYAALSAFLPRSGYRFTAENSVYVREDLHRRGVGRALLCAALERGRAAGLREVVALIESSQAGSLGLHASLGFREAGRLFRVGFKFGQWLDVVYMQKSLVEGAPAMEGAAGSAC